jgi:elongation factor P
MIKLQDMIIASQLRAGITFKDEGRAYKVIEYKHTKVGRGTASIRVKVRDFETGAVMEKTFISGAKVEPLETENRNLQYLYRDDDSFYFMDSKSFDQSVLSKKLIGDDSRFLQEGRDYRVLFVEDKPLSVELPLSLIFTVKEAEPGVKGDSAAGATKSAILENGLKIKVPLFIKDGDKVKVDTRTGDYLERVSGQS